MVVTGFRRTGDDGSRETLSFSPQRPTSSPAGNNVFNLVQIVVLNYMALHGTQGQFATLFPNQGLGNAAAQDAITAFEPIVNGKIA